MEEYYVALPEALKVHSLFATHILSHALHHYGIRTRVLPCRLWCSLPRSDKEFPGGFANFFDTEKWNGHVVCLVGDWLVDAALYHLNPTFNFEVPKIVARRIALPESGIYTRYRLNPTTEFVWYRLPPQAAAIPVSGYEDFIERFVTMLVAHVNVLLGVAQESVPGEQTLEEQNMSAGQDVPKAAQIEYEEPPSLAKQVLDDDAAELAEETATDFIEVPGEGTQLPVAEDSADQEPASVEEAFALTGAEPQAAEAENA